MGGSGWVGWGGWGWVGRGAWVGGGGCSEYHMVDAIDMEMDGASDTELSVH